MKRLKISQHAAIVVSAILVTLLSFQANAMNCINVNPEKTYLEEKLGNEPLVISFIEAREKFLKASDQYYAKPIAEQLLNTDGEAVLHKIPQEIHEVCIQYITLYDALHTKYPQLNNVTIEEEMSL